MPFQHRAGGVDASDDAGNGTGGLVKLLHMILPQRLLDGVPPALVGGIEEVAPVACERSGAGHSMNAVACVKIGAN